MKTLPKSLFVVIVAAAAMQAPGGETPKTAPAKPVASRSVFVVPAHPGEGRDPFFPESTRTYDALAAANRSTVEISTITFKGVSGTPGHYVAIINNHAFKVGDESAVRTQSGQAHIRCLEIRPTMAVIEINGQRRELSLTNPH